MTTSLDARSTLTELVRPWKLVTFALGIVGLVAGAMLSRLPDWNIPVSLLMAFATYLSASWVLGVFITRRWNLMPVALLTAWGTIYGCYVGYWQFTDPSVLASLPYLPLIEITCLYVMAGLVWLYPGSINEFAENLKRVTE